MYTSSILYRKYWCLILHKNTMIITKLKSTYISTFLIFSIIQWLQSETNGQDLPLSNQVARTWFPHDTCYTNQCPLLPLTVQEIAENGRVGYVPRSCTSGTNQGLTRQLRIPHQIPFWKCEFCHNSKLIKKKEQLSTIQGKKGNMVEGTSKATTKYADEP
jgi:hypothetical protein